MNFNERLKYIRAKQGYDRKEFAVKAEISYAQYCNYERQSFPSMANLIKIKKTLDCSWDYLMEGKKQEAPAKAKQKQNQYLAGYKCAMADIANSIKNNIHIREREMK